jgi:hypothetical protein
MDIFIGIIIIILSLTGALIPSFKKPIKIYRRKPRLTGWGQATIVIVIGLVCLQTAQLIKNQNDKIEFDNILKKKDSLNKVFVQTENNRLAKSFGEGLGKYGFKFDSAKTELIALKKTVERDTNKAEVKPEIGHEPFVTEIEGDTLKLTRKLIVKQATAYNVNISVYSVMRGKALQLSPCEKISTLNTPKIVIDFALEKEYTSISMDSKKDETTKIYFFSIGTYKNSKGKVFPYKEISAYDMKTQFTNPLTEKEEKWIEDYFKKCIGSKKL